MTGGAFCVVGCTLLVAARVPEPEKGFESAAAPAPSVVWPVAETVGSWQWPQPHEFGARRSDIVAHVRELPHSERHAALEAALMLLSGLDPPHLAEPVHALARDLASVAIQDGDLSLAASFYEFAARPEFPGSLRFGALTQLGSVYLYMDDGNRVANLALGQDAMLEALEIVKDPPVGLIIPPAQELDVWRKLAYFASQEGDQAKSLAMYTSALERVGDRVTEEHRVQLLKDAARAAAGAGDISFAASLGDRVLTEHGDVGLETGDPVHWALEMTSVLRLNPEDPRYSAILEQAVLDNRMAGSHASIAACINLATSYQMQGLHEDALNLLQQTFTRFDGTTPPTEESLWPFSSMGEAMGRVGMQLSMALRESGNEAEAERIETYLLQRYPDSDHARDIRTKRGRR